MKAIVTTVFVIGSLIGAIYLYKDEMWATPIVEEGWTFHVITQDHVMIPAPDPPSSGWVATCYYEYQGELHPLMYKDKGNRREYSIRYRATEPLEADLESIPGIKFIIIEFSYDVNVYKTACYSWDELDESISKVFQKWANPQEREGKKSNEENIFSRDGVRRPVI